MPLIEIAYFQQNLTFGATEEYLYDLAKSVNRNVFRVHLICPDIDALDRFSELQSDGVIVHRYPQTVYSNNLIDAIIYLRQMLKRIKPSIVHFNDICIRGILAAKVASVPVSIMTHHTPELNRRYSLLGAFAEKLAFLKGPFVVFTSEQDRHTGRRNDAIDTTRSCVIPYGLRPIWFQSSNSARASIRKELGIPSDHIVVLSAARLSLQKRHDVLIEAARNVLTKTKHVTFLLAGDGELRSQTENLIAEKRIEAHFKLLGHRRDIQALMLASDIFAISSDFEGLCYAIIEAAASGLPTVATNVGGLALSVADQETGILVPAGDALALASALEELILNPSKRHSFGASAQRRANLLFNLERMVKETEDCYRTLLEQSSA